MEGCAGADAARSGSASDPACSGETDEGSGFARVGRRQGGRIGRFGLALDAMVFPWTFRGSSSRSSHIACGLGVSLAQMLATQSVISPSPSARLIRFKLLEELLTKRCEKTAAIQVLDQLITISPFAQLRAGAVSVLRSAMSSWLLAPQASEEEPERVPNSDLVALLDKIIALPAGLQVTDLEEQTTQQQAEKVVEESGKLTELLSLLYWLETQRAAGKLGSSICSNLDKYRKTFVEPLGELLDRGLNSNDDSTDSNDAAEQQRQQQQRQQQRQQLELVQIALQRLSERQTPS